MVKRSQGWISKYKRPRSLHKIKKLKEIPKNKNIITSIWVFKNKRNSRGNISKRNTLLVVRSFSQQERIDYEETFLTTLKQNSLKLIISIFSQYKYNIYQRDIKNAYLNIELKENI